MGLFFSCRRWPACEALALGVAMMTETGARVRLRFFICGTGVSSLSQTVFYGEFGVGMLSGNMNAFAVPCSMRLF